MGSVNGCCQMDPKSQVEIESSIQNSLWGRGRSGLKKFLKLRVLVGLRRKEIGRQLSLGIPVQISERCKTKKCEREGNNWGPSSLTNL